MLPPVFQVLNADAAVAAIIGSPARAYRHDRAPQDTTRPYVTWLVVSNAPENELSDVPGMYRYTVQVDCWHPEDAGVVDLAESVRDAIEPNAHMTGMPVNQREPETKLFRIALQFDWFVPRRAIS